MLLFQTVNEKMSEGSALTTQRLPTFYPSAASCRSETDGKIIGTCLRSQWFRCKGYEESNPVIAFLKMKNFVISNSFTDEELHDKQFVKKLVNCFETAKPFIDFINRSMH